MVVFDVESFLENEITWSNVGVGNYNIADDTADIAITLSFRNKEFTLTKNNVKLGLDYRCSDSIFQKKNADEELVIVDGDIENELEWTSWANYIIMKHARQLLAKHIRETASIKLGLQNYIAIHPTKAQNNVCYWSDEKHKLVERFDITLEDLFKCVLDEAA